MSAAQLWEDPGRNLILTHRTGGVYYTGYINVLYRVHQCIYTRNSTLLYVPCLSSSGVGGVATVFYGSIVASTVLVQ